MKTYFLPAIKITVLTAILFGIIYPFLIVGIAKVVAPGNGGGETIEVDGRKAGFALIGQSFQSAKYFNSRPSAVNYNAAATGGSNKGTHNPDYLKEIEKRIEDFLLKNPGSKKEQIPVDLITASGGGLDPNISVQAAVVQIPRVALIRNMKESAVRNLIDKNTHQPVLGIFGPWTVDVLRLNIDLDHVTK